MRATVVLDPDTARAVEQLCRDGRDVNAAVNELTRRGLSAGPTRAPFVPRTQQLGIRTDVSNVADALERLEGPLAH